MRQTAVIRARVVARVRDMLEHLRIQVSLTTPDEREVLTELSMPKQAEHGVELANHLMQILGDDSCPVDPRFDKTRREMTKVVKRGRPPKIRPEALNGEPSAT